MENISNKQTKDEKSGYEKSDINLKIISVYVILSIVVIVSFIIILSDYFVVEKEEIVSEIVLQPVSEELQKLHKTENEILTTYGVVDSVNSIYRIPIDRAMQILVEQSSQK